MPASTPSKTKTKSVKKGAEGEEKKRKKHQFTSYSRYIHQLMKAQFLTKKGKDSKGKTIERVKVAITSRGMGIVNSFVVDLFERLAEEAGRASQFAGSKTLRSGAIMAAVKMHLPEGMANHAAAAGVSAVTHYTKALEQKPSYQAALAKREEAAKKRKKRSPKKKQSPKKSERK
eukprot:TRINITY_DN37_c0_g1_i5.p2 TRINITY_DN37_c0_g1~~TRINITY_DN37_c0_g1_i5.p2  ORF type:complete len:196 (+),score=100.52 TRINITY_DN37_c0_g1_i5:68-589(+)